MNLAYTYGMYYNLALPIGVHYNHYVSPSIRGQLVKMLITGRANFCPFIVNINLNPSRHPYFEYARNKGSGETARMYRLV